jgi:hypothetical protein
VEFRHIVAISGQIGIPLNIIAAEIVARFNVGRLINFESNSGTFRENLSESVLLDYATFDIPLLIPTRNPLDIFSLESAFNHVKTIYFQANLSQRAKVLFVEEGNYLALKDDKNLDQEILQTRANVVSCLDNLEQLRINPSSILNLDRLFANLGIHSSKKRIK